VTTVRRYFDFEGHVLCNSSFYLQVFVVKWWKNKKSK